MVLAADAQNADVEQFVHLERLPSLRITIAPPEAQERQAQSALTSAA